MVRMQKRRIRRPDNDSKEETGSKMETDCILTKLAAIAKTGGTCAPLMSWIVRAAGQCKTVDSAIIHSPLNKIVVGTRWMLIA